MLTLAEAAADETAVEEDVLPFPCAQLAVHSLARPVPIKIKTGSILRRRTGRKDIAGFVRLSARFMNLFSVSRLALPEIGAEA